MVLAPLLTGDGPAPVAINLIKGLIPLLSRDGATFVLVNEVEQIRDLAIKVIFIGVRVATHARLVQQSTQLLDNRAKDVEVRNALPTNRKRVLARNDPADPPKPQRERGVRKVGSNSEPRSLTTLLRHACGTNGDQHGAHEDEERHCGHLCARDEDVQVHEQDDDACKHHRGCYRREALVQVAEIPANLVVGQRQNQPEGAQGHRDACIGVVAAPLPLQLLIELQVIWTSAGQIHGLPATRLSLPAACLLLLLLCRTAAARRGGAVLQQALTTVIA
mmetsp:Transcript_77423/g.195519  ORF Transcript_77423/g.195519 Transcript_77423/m.195519 type:complete len:276 (-) Transcript_77423:656-1483(-)